MRSSGIVAEAKRTGLDLTIKSNYAELKPSEKDLIQKLYEYPKAIDDAATNYDPSVIALFSYELAKAYNRFWHECKILKEENTDARLFRLQLSQMTAHTLQHSMDLLGIEMPERM